MLRLSASSDAWPWRRPCLIVVPETAKSVVVVIKGGDSGAGKSAEWKKTASSAFLRCRYGETKEGATRRRYAEQDIKWLGRCEAGATWARGEPRPPRKVDHRERRRRRRSGDDDARLVIEVTADGGGDDRVLELRYSTVDADAVQQQQQQQQTRVIAGEERPTTTRTVCDGRPPSPARLSSGAGGGGGGFVLGGEDGECAVAVHLGHAYKVRLKIFPSASEVKGELQLQRCPLGSPSPPSPPW